VAADYRVGVHPKDIKNPENVALFLDFRISVFKLVCGSVAITEKTNGKTVPLAAELTEGQATEALTFVLKAFSG
jgi:hypothetical protein